MPDHAREIDDIIERTTRHFYEKFKQQRIHFLACIHETEGHQTDEALREKLALRWQNRLIFLYFLQKKGLLENDTSYLSHTLARVQRQTGPNTFYQTFLLPLFYPHAIRMAEHAVAETSSTILAHLTTHLSSTSPDEEQTARLIIDDEAFEHFFLFLDQYQWQLSCEKYSDGQLMITPDALGYILEQCINQQQIGAYYTRKDVTDYIANNTIIPAFLEKMREDTPSLFKSEGPIWNQLLAAPERYITSIIRSPERLIDETRHEYIERQAYLDALTDQLRAGQIRDFDDFITYNLNVSQFACDIIDMQTDPEILLRWYDQLQQITILDPTCGSGAFLFAAIRTLYPLYQHCLTGLQRFQATQADQHNDIHDYSYQIITTIIRHNIYGVDIMEGAIEICKMRLLLKLYAHMPEIEAIPTIPELDQHIRVGNALVDRDTMSPDGPAVHWKNTPPTQYFSTWREAFPAIFAQGGFTVTIGNPPYVEYIDRTFLYTLHNFATRNCGNLYPCIIERSRDLLAPHGREGMILPLAAFATNNMRPFLDTFLQYFPGSWVSFYHFRPTMLFSGDKMANIPTTIFIARASGTEKRFSTQLHKWTRPQRARLFAEIKYTRITLGPDPTNQFYYPKFGYHYDNTIMQKVRIHTPIRTYITRTPNQNRIYYRSAGGLYWKIFVNFSWPYTTTSNKCCFIHEDYDRDVFIALLNSSLFWWYYTVTFDTFNLKDYMLFGFRFSYPQKPETISQLKEYSQQLMADFQYHARHLRRGTTGSYTIYARESKPILDKIDRVLARHYALTEDEAAFILQYDAKYRMGFNNDMRKLH